MVMINTNMIYELRVSTPNVNRYLSALSDTYRVAGYLINRDSVRTKIGLIHISSELKYKTNNGAVSCIKSFNQRSALRMSVRLNNKI